MANNVNCMIASITDTDTQAITLMPCKASTNKLNLVWEEQTLLEHRGEGDGILYKVTIPCNQL